MVPCETTWLNPVDGAVEEPCGHPAYPWCSENHWHLPHPQCSFIPVLLLLPSITPVLILLCVTHHLVPPSWHTVLLGLLGPRHWHSPSDASCSSLTPASGCRQTDIPRAGGHRIMGTNRNPSGREKIKDQRLEKRVLAREQDRTKECPGCHNWYLWSCQWATSCQRASNLRRS